jgi:hypothetical protein
VTHPQTQKEHHRRHKAAQQETKEIMNKMMEE